jgi:hypothetical protein
MSVDGEPQFRFISVEDGLSVEERAATFYADAVILVHTLYTAKGLDPSQALSPLEIEYAEAQKRADEAIAAYGGDADELTLKPVMVGTEMLDLLAPANWGHIDRDKVVRLTELAQQLPGNAPVQESETQPFVIKKDVTPKDIADMVRKALAIEDGGQ